MKTPLTHLLCLGSSLVISLTTHAQTTVIAFEVPAGTAGNQAFDGALGMEFDVAKPVTITELECFDDLSNGLSRLIAVRLYDRDSLEVLASADFGPGDEGTLVGGSRFKPLATALSLPVGFHGTIVAEGYGGAERNGNRGIGPLSLTFNDGSGSVLKVGSGRYNYPVVPGAYPENPDQGPEDRYAAGTFEFQTSEPAATVPPIPFRRIPTEVPRTAMPPELLPLNRTCLIRI